MQVVSTVVRRKQLCRTTWVSQHRIEIDHSIEFTTFANPIVHLLTYGFPLGSIKSAYQSLERGVLKRGVYRPNDTNAFCMATPDGVLIAGNNVFSTYLFARRSESKCRKKHVIDAQTHDNVSDAGLSQHVPIEPRQPGFAQARSKWVSIEEIGVLNEGIIGNRLLHDSPSDLAISLFLPERTEARTLHSLAKQTSYVSPETGDSTGVVKFPVAKAIHSWPLLTGVDVEASTGAAAIVAFGSSLTDGDGTKDDTNGRWPDVLAERLQNGRKEIEAVIRGSPNVDGETISGPWQRR
jgi:hypothetical protein